MTWIDWKVKHLDGNKVRINFENVAHISDFYTILIFYLPFTILLILTSK